MYVYLCTDSSNSINTNTSVKIYRDPPSSSIDSLDLFELTTTDDDDTLFQNSTKSTSYVTTNVPLVDLIDAAQSRNILLVEEKAKAFLKQIEKLIETSDLVTSMFDTKKNKTLIRSNLKTIQHLSSQILNWARKLVTCSKAKDILKTLNQLCSKWEKTVRVLVESIDEIISIEDFLSISEDHLTEDINICIQAIIGRNFYDVDQKSECIRKRVDRILNVMMSETKTIHTDKHIEIIDVLHNQIMPNFEKKLDLIKDHLRNNRSVHDDRQYNLIVQEFIESLNFIHHSVHDLHNLISINSSPEWTSDDENCSLVQITPVNNKKHTVEQIKHENALESMKQNTEIDEFEKIKRNFEIEVFQWDDHCNDIVHLAKQMYMIITETTDLIRSSNKSSLDKTIDILNAVKIISQCGLNLNKFAKSIAAHCNESQTKFDLITYVDQINYYCSQLMHEDFICDSTNLLFNATKNLMNALIVIVKASFIASRNCSNSSNNEQPIVQWKRCITDNHSLMSTNQEKKKINIKKRYQSLNVNEKYSNMNQTLSSYH